MEHVNFFKDLFESIPDYRKKIFKVFNLKRHLQFRRMWLLKKMILFIYA